jgi:hypothetical protein
MQKTPFILCREDINGRSRVWPTTRRWGGMGEAGDLKPHAAFTPPSSAGRLWGRLKSLPVVRSTPARGARLCRPAPARRPGGAAAIAATRSVVGRVPGRGECAGTRGDLCGVETSPGTTP